MLKEVAMLIRNAINSLSAKKEKLGLIVFLQKKCTYAYSEFVLGKYDKNNQHNLVEKLNRMTIQEKMIISSFEFITSLFRKLRENHDPNAM